MQCEAEQFACATRRGRGFTLIELIVVVAVIGLLLAIMTPTLSQARKKARATVCQTNERALGTALRMYISDWKVATLYGDHPSANGAWDYQLLGGSQTRDDFYNAAGRADVTSRIRICPETSDPGSNGYCVGTATSQWTCGSSAGYVTGSYGFNTWLQTRPNGSQPRGIFRVTRALPEHDIPAFVDAVSHDLVPVESDPVGNLSAPGGSSNYGTLTSAAINRHRMAVNVSFLDGHVEAVKLVDLWVLRWSSKWSRTTPQTLP